MEQSVYLAGPIQHAADHGKGWRERLKCGDIKHSADVKFIDPLDKYNTHEMEAEEWSQENIVREDIELIAESDAVLVHWLEVPTCGTPMEVFFASWFPQFASVIENLATQIVSMDDSNNSSESDVVAEAFRNAEIPWWMFSVARSINSDVPVVIQTNVPEEEISPWLTKHADVVLESFDESLEWIEDQKI
jgi:hypothetical protein